MFFQVRELGESAESGSGSENAYVLYRSWGITGSVKIERRILLIKFEVPFDCRVFIIYLPEVLRKKLVLNRNG